MKINQSTSSRPAANAAGDGAARTAGNAASAAGTARTAANGDLSMSPLAAQVRELSAKLSQPADDDIDTAKVEQIRQAIAEGRIKIDPSKIADGLLATIKELGQGTK